AIATRLLRRQSIPGWASVEAIIQANLERVDPLFDADRGACRSREHPRKRAREGRLPAAKIQIIIFDFGRYVVREAVFDSDTDQPSNPRFISGKGKDFATATSSGNGITIMREGHSAFGKNHPSIRRVSNPARNVGEPIRFGGKSTDGRTLIRKERI